MTDPLFSEEKVAKLKKLFDRFDRDKSGYINKNDIGEIIKALRTCLTPGEIESMIKEASGSLIDFNEFLEIFARKNPDTEDDLIEAFKLFDREGNGYVNAEEIRIMLTTFGEKLNKEEADEMLMEAEVSDGYINYYDLARKIMTR